MAEQLQSMTWSVRCGDYFYKFSLVPRNGRKKGREGGRGEETFDGHDKCLLTSDG